MPTEVKTYKGGSPIGCPANQFNVYKSKIE